MEIFIIIIVLLIIWFFTSTSKSEDVKTAIKFTKEATDETNKFLDDLNSRLDKFNSELEEKNIEKFKNRLYELSEREYLEDFDELNKSLGLTDSFDEVTWLVDAFKEAGRYDEISHLVIKKNNVKSSFFSSNKDKYVINLEYGELKRERATREKLAQEKLAKEKLAKEKLAKDFSETESIIDIDKYAGEVDSYLIDFLKIRFYLAGKRSYPDLKCVDQYFNFKFSHLDKSSYSSIWKNIVSATVFDSDKRKNIDAIYHFTHKSNLPSILEYGVLTRANLNKMNLRYAFNDQMRLDGVLDSISLSFSHPNFKMFYKYRKQTGEDDWVVLKISPLLLYGREQDISNGIIDFNYLNKAVFCHTNAASNKMRNLSIEERMTCDAFLDMFESPIGRSLPTYTYDNQAEILYLGDIPVNFIEEIHVNHEDESLNWVKELGYKVTENDVVFDQRRYRDG